MSTQFRALAVGDSFDFISPDAGLNSFYLRCHKTGPRTYRDETGTDHRVGRIAAKVYNVVDRETLMIAAHRAGVDYAREIDSTLRGAHALADNRPHWTADQRIAFLAGYRGELARMTGTVQS